MNTGDAGETKAEDCDKVAKAPEEEKPEEEEKEEEEEQPGGIGGLELPGGPGEEEISMIGRIAGAAEAAGGAPEKAVEKMKEVSRLAITGVERFNRHMLFWTLFLAASSVTLAGAHQSDRRSRLRYTIAR
ncbi:MAG: hypothetical protein ACRD4B_08325, partial [Acidobacteriota bacterium]